MGARGRRCNADMFSHLLVRRANHVVAYVDSIALYRDQLRLLFALGFGLEVLGPSSRRRQSETSLNVWHKSNDQ
jgi:hypothetical protein